MVVSASDGCECCESVVRVEEGREEGGIVSSCTVSTTCMRHWSTTGAMCCVIMVSRDKQCLQSSVVIVTMKCIFMID